MADKDLNVLCEQYHLQYDEANNAIFGKLESFDVVITKVEEKFLCTFGVHCNTEDDKKNFEQFIDEYPQNNNHILTMAYEEEALTILIAGDDNANVTNIQTLLEELLDYFRTNHMKNVCKICGEEKYQIPCSINGMVHNMCNECLNDYQKNIESSKKDGNVFLGAIGAFLGSLIGVALWVLIYQLGYIAGFAGAAIFYLSIKGYELFGKRLNKISLTYCVILSIIMIFVAENLSLLVEVFRYFRDALDNNIFNLDFMVTLKDNWADPEYRGYLIKDLAVGYGLFALASLTNIIRMYKATDTKTEITRL